MQDSLVSTTNVPGVLRVAFRFVESDTAQTEIVTFVRPIDGRIEINYCHHSHLSRVAQQGPWESSNDFRYPLTPALTAQIKYGVVAALCEGFGHVVRTLPAPIHTTPEKVAWA